MAHGTDHGNGTHGNAPVDAHPAAHGGHHDVSEDKGAAYVGLFAGALLLGSFLFGMVKWTNHHLSAGEPAGAAAAESAK